MRRSAVAKLDQSLRQRQQCSA